MESTSHSEYEVAAAELKALGFSPEEAERLARFRMAAQARGEHAERQAVERRLEFIRWLVDHGRIKH